MVADRPTNSEDHVRCSCITRCADSHYAWASDNPGRLAPPLAWRPRKAAYFG